MLCIVVFCVVAIVNIFANLFEWTDVANRIIDYANSTNKYILAAILFVILAIALVIFIFEFYKKKMKTASISSDSAGKTMVTLKTASLQIKDSLKNIEGLTDVKVNIVPKQNGVVINIFSKLVSGVSVMDKTKEIRETAADFASKELGFKVLQTNYTVNGFISGKVNKEVSKVEEQSQAEEEGKEDA
jgi:hypothetical protein